MSKLISRIASRPLSKLSEEEKAAKQAMESLRAYRRHRVASRQLPSQPKRL